jgi:HD-GYP domain-containing protein (c-di-GMP phosphodiesterase class II)
LADRVAVKISSDKSVLSQVSGICEAITQGKGDVFNPDHVDAMLRLSKRDYIWLDVISNSIESILWRSISYQSKELDINELRDFAWLICRLIDFKSEFTATHSSGVAATASAVAELVGFSDHENKLMEIAAYLHDLGKLAIPSEILEKPAKLSDDEWFIMRSHVYYTYQMLEPISVLGIISSWGALHQERLNGTGYPFGYKEEELPFGSRILAVADVFTALTEDRPYRKGMNKKETVDVLQSMAAKGELDENLINLVLEHFDEMNIIRNSAQKKAIQEYKEFQASLC